MFVGRERVDSIAPSGERVIIAIDEYPYLAASYPAISSLLQSHIDSCWKDSRIFLILCGSSMSFMEEQVLGYKSPLYGRRTADLCKSTVSNRRDWTLVGE